VSALDMVLSVFPPPRRPLRLRAVVAPLAFILAMAAVVLYLELADVVFFERRSAFFLAGVLPWVWWQHEAGYSGLRGVRSVVALFVRLLLVAGFVMLLASPRAVRTSDVLSVVYAVDVSDSIGEGARDSALEFVARTASGKPERDEAGLVVFGRDAAVELPPRTTFPLEAINSRITTDGTNIERGLSLAAAMLPQENAGRVVLISDGTQTEGNLPAVLDELKAREVAVDVLGVAYDYDEEVWLEKLELPQIVRAEETYEAAIILSSLRAGEGRLVLRENGQTIFEGDVEFQAGKNRYELPLYMRGPGYYEYVATIQVPPGRDGWKENNRAVNHLFLRGEGKVLVVTDPNGDPRDWAALTGALGEGGFAIEAMEAYAFPRSAMSLMPYDCIIFPNCPADAFDLMQMEALYDAVSDQGTGFLMVGGPNSFGPGGYHRTPVEKALPVTMDITQKRVMPKGALVIILHTCEFPEGNTWGKRVAKRAIQVLSVQDEVGVLVYDYQGGEQWLFDLTPASEYEELAVLINEAQIGDMPQFATTMQMGLNSLKNSDAAVKHMIIISDGDPQPPTPQLLQAFVQAGVSVSTVAVFPHGGQDTSIMQGIAQATGGRYYYPQDPAQLPSIFVKEAKTLRRSMIQNETFTPVINTPTSVLKGIETIPPLHGLVLTTPKGRATVVLRSPEEEQVDPVLAVWRCGLGKTAAFTSDLSTNWGADWVTWERYKAFVSQLVNDITRTAEEGSLRMKSFAAGGQGFISVEDFHDVDSFLDVEATVKGPQNRTETVRLRQSGPRRYEVRFPLWGQGRYQVAAVGVGGGRNERAVGGIIVPYSPEYLRFRSSPGALRQIAEKTGGRLLRGNETSEEIFVQERKPRSSSRPIPDWFLIALACLLPLDVAVRRIQLDWQVVKGWLTLGRAAGPSTETMGALLARKKAISFGEPDREAAGPRRVGLRRQAPAAGPREEARPKEPAAPVAPAAGEDLTTTQRLLRRRQARRQRGEGKDNE
jgi:uncharacterized membrane protein/Mg-chelatase subunit ChlD